jgi:hypothetical protein
MNYLEGPAQDLLPWVSRDMFKTDMVDGENLVYAIGNVYDPVINQRFNHDNNDHDFKTVWDLSSKKKSITGMEFMERVRSNFRVPANVVFAIQESGEIGYVAQGLFPHRKYKVGQGSYTKLGWMDDNQWLGFVPSSE